jgi:FkbM family methyltransferase
MPAEHALPLVLHNHPQYNRPLALAVAALVSSSNGAPLTVVDVGANIGETVTIIEQRNSGLCSYLCIEADAELAALCRYNHRDNPNVQTIQTFIGEDENALVLLEDDGRGNPSTKLVNAGAAPPGTAGNRLVRLDTAAGPFADAHGFLSLVKVDVEGYDFSVLRSGSKLLTQYHPAVYFEWFPALLNDLNESVWGGFEYLASLGYEHFVFFSSIGDYYCNLSKPDRSILQNLARAAARNKSLLYFDVFASTSLAVVEALVELSMSAA